MLVVYNPAFLFYGCIWDRNVDPAAYKQDHPIWHPLLINCFEDLSSDEVRKLLDCLLGRLVNVPGDVDPAIADWSESDLLKFIKFHVYPDRPSQVPDGSSGASELARRVNTILISEYRFDWRNFLQQRRYYIGKLCSSSDAWNCPDEELWKWRTDPFLLRLMKVVPAALTPDQIGFFTRDRLHCLSGQIAEDLRRDRPKEVNGTRDPTPAPPRRHKRRKLNPDAEAERAAKREQEKSDKRLSDAWAGGNGQYQTQEELAREKGITKREL